MSLPEEAEQSSWPLFTEGLPADRPAGIVSVMVALAVVGPLLTVTSRRQLKELLMGSEPPVLLLLAMPTLGVGGAVQPLTLVVALAVASGSVPASPPPETEALLVMGSHTSLGAVTTMVMAGAAPPAAITALVVQVTTPAPPPPGPRPAPPGERKGHPPHPGHH